MALTPSASAAYWLLGWPQPRGEGVCTAEEVALCSRAALRLPCRLCTAPALSGQSDLQAPGVASPSEGGRACSAVAPGVTRASDAHVLPTPSGPRRHLQSRAPGAPLALRCCVRPAGNSLLLNTTRLLVVGDATRPRKGLVRNSPVPSAGGSPVEAALMAPLSP